MVQRRSWTTENLQYHLPPKTFYYLSQNNNSQFVQLQIAKTRSDFVWTWTVLYSSIRLGSWPLHFRRHQNPSLVYVSPLPRQTSPSRRPDPSNRQNLYLSLLCPHPSHCYWSNKDLWPQPQLEHSLQSHRLPLALWMHKTFPWRMGTFGPSCLPATGYVRLGLWTTLAHSLRSAALFKPQTSRQLLSCQRPNEATKIPPLWSQRKTLANFTISL